MGMPFSSFCGMPTPVRSMPSWAWRSFDTAYGCGVGNESSTIGERLNIIRMIDSTEVEQDAYLEVDLLDNLVGLGGIFGRLAVDLAENFKRFLTEMVALEGEARSFANGSALGILDEFIFLLFV